MKYTSAMVNVSLMEGLETFIITECRGMVLEGSSNPNVLLFSGKDD